jgi:tetratricopeptide (TPR) repeat protein
MLTPETMATNKNLLRRSVCLVTVVLAVCGLTGCGPAGTRDLLQGKYLMEQGKYPEAIVKLGAAADAMGTNAQAWNYLGLACQLGGQADAAANAYQKAIHLDRSLMVAHFNYGCLLLEENQADKLPGARDELTEYTLHEGNSAPAWTKLGTVQSRLRDAVSAEKSFYQALQINSNNPEAFNGLGLAEWQLNHRREAVTCFNNALAEQHDYGPALLNLAILEQGIMSERAQALQRYHQYLTLNPKPANWDAVNEVAQRLEEEINPPRAVPQEAATTTPKPPQNPPANNPPRPNPVTNAVKKPATPTTTVAENNSNGGGYETVQMANQSNAQVVPTPQTPVRSPNTVAESSGSNPVAQESNGADAGRRPTTSTGAPQFARYAYVNPGKPAAGNRTLAEQYFAQAAQAQAAKKLRDAVGLYRAAAREDGSFFEAQANLGLAEFELGDLPQSLLAYETALAIRPDSFNARFNFALALIKGNYVMDAAEQLEKLLATTTDATADRLAMAHLTLANIYAEQFHRPASAKPHYEEVLKLDPDNSQATVIRYWLRDHP